MLLCWRILTLDVPRTIHVLLGWKGISDYSALNRLRIELSSAELYLTLSCGEGGWGVVHSNHCILHAKDVIMQGGHLDIWVSLHDFDVIAEVHRAVTLKLDDFCVGLPNFQVLAHVQIGREELILLRIDHWEGMNRDQDLVAIAMNSYRIVEVLILIVRRELDIDVLADT